PAPVHSPPAPTPVPLRDVAAAVRLTIAAADHAGVSRARIALHPAELGSVEVSLAHSSAGLTATITAESG
ncbi:flagellar hook-length control protein FliK, partial [Escherichia coli]